jgi:hypothetical protein
MLDNQSPAIVPASGVPIQSQPVAFAARRCFSSEGRGGLSKSSTFAADAEECRQSTTVDWRVQVIHAPADRSTGECEKEDWEGSRLGDNIPSFASTVRDL